MHVLTVSETLPYRLVDDLLSATEEVLLRAGAERVWIDSAQAALQVLADFGDAGQGAREASAPEL